MIPKILLYDNFFKGNNLEYTAYVNFKVRQIESLSEVFRFEDND